MGSATVNVESMVSKPVAPRGQSGRFWFSPGRPQAGRYATHALVNNRNLNGSAKDYGGDERFRAYSRGFQTLAVLTPGRSPKRALASSVRMARSVCRAC